jgi:hypothetical protein
MRSKDLREIHTELEKYLKTVVLPKGGALAVRTGAEVSTEDVLYGTHVHNSNDSRCAYCMEQATDGQS